MPKHTPASELLQDAMERAGGQAQLAARLGVSQQAVSHWRRRGRAPEARAAALEAIAQGPAAAPLVTTPRQAPPRINRAPRGAAPPAQDAPMFLTRAEVEALTARQRTDAQAHELDLMGVTHKRRTDGSVVVLRALVEHLFGFSTTRTQVEVVEPHVQP